MTFTDLLYQTATVTRPEIDGYDEGTPIDEPGEGVTYTVRVEYDSGFEAVVTGSDQRFNERRATLYVGPEADIRPQDTVTVDDLDDVFEVTLVRPQQGFGALHHYEVDLRVVVNA